MISPVATLVVSQSKALSIVVGPGRVNKRIVTISLQKARPPCVLTRRDSKNS
jgi:hypothetical protein